MTSEFETCIGRNGSGCARPHELTDVAGAIANTAGHPVDFLPEQVGA
jgi:hypothetical protein